MAHADQEQWDQLSREHKAYPCSRAMLTIQQLDGLGSYLRFSPAGAKPCDDSYRLTKVWLKDHMYLGPEDVNEALKWLEGEGGCCDNEVIYNVVGKYVPRPY